MKYNRCNTDSIECSIEECNKRIMDSRDDINAYFERGKYYLQSLESYRVYSKCDYTREYIDLAINDLSVFINNCDTNSEAFSKRGDAYLKKYFFEQSSSNNEMEKNSNSNEHPVDFYFNLAINDYNKSLDIDKSCTTVYSSIGMAYYRNSIGKNNPSHLSLAIDNFVKYLSFSDDYAIYLRLGLSYYHMYNIDKQLQFIKMSISNIKIALMSMTDSWPMPLFRINYTFSHINRFSPGLCKINDSEYDMIVSCYTLAIDIMPHKWFLYVYRGIAYYIRSFESESSSSRYTGFREEREKWWDFAISDFKKAAELMPHNLFIFRALFRLYYLKRNNCYHLDREDCEYLLSGYEGIAEDAGKYMHHYYDCAESIENQVVIQYKLKSLGW